MTEDGASLGSWSFTTFAAANTFFSDNVVSLGSSWKTPGENTLDLNLKLTLVTDTPGQAFYTDGVIVTPIPGAVWLFGSALGAFGFFGRRRSQACATA